MKLVGAAEAAFHRAGDAGDLAAHLFDSLGAALLGALHAPVQGLGHAQDLAAHGFDGARRALLDGGDLLGHLVEARLDQV